MMMGGLWAKRLRSARFVLSGRAIRGDNYEREEEVRSEGGNSENEKSKGADAGSRLPGLIHFFGSEVGTC